MARTPTSGGSQRPTSADLSEQMDRLRADVSSLREMLGDYGKGRGREAVDEARSRASELNRDVRHRATEARRAGERHFDEFTTDAEARMRNNPGTTLGLAAGLGFLVGLLFGRR